MSMLARIAVYAAKCPADSQVLVDRGAWFEVLRELLASFTVQRLQNGNWLANDVGYALVGRWIVQAK